MPNYCDYEMKIKGSKKAIERVIKCLNADYNYGEGKPSHKHFFRVFQADKGDLEANKDGTFTQYIFGYCAWSVSSCMCSGPFTYYDKLKKDYPDTFMGTTLAEQSEDCTIEVFSEEPGMGFSEHYIYEKGVCIKEEETEISFKDTDYETIVINPFRFKKRQDFLWSF